MAAKLDCGLIEKFGEPVSLLILLDLEGEVEKTKFMAMGLVP